MAKLASRVYGDALFDLALQDQKVEERKEEVVLVQKALADNPELSLLMCHPRIADDEKIRLMENCFEESVSADMMGFLVTVVDKGRFQEIPFMLARFLDRAREHQEIGRVFVTSAAELDKMQKRKIEEKLLETTRYHTMEISYQVDARLIGGLIIRIKDRVADASIRHKLDQMTGQMMKISLELEKKGG